MKSLKKFKQAQPHPHSVKSIIIMINKNTPYLILLAIMNGGRLVAFQTNGDVIIRGVASWGLGPYFLEGSRESLCFVW